MTVAPSTLNIEQLSMTLPEILRPVFAEASQKLIEQSIESIPEELLPSFPIAFSCSEYLANILTLYPDLTRELFSSGDLLRSLGGSELLTACLTATEGLDDEVEFQRALRLYRHRQLVRIAWRDLAGLAELSETLADLSALADAVQCAALRWSEISLSERYGRPTSVDGKESCFVILAMGKLGGGELNFSSDIDLVFLFSESADTNGRQSVTAPEYYRLLAQRFIKVLDERTADGFVFRVDVRLRPFGTSGPLAVSEMAFEEYLMTHGRDWERYAYVKARVVNDWPGAKEFYENILRPFVYRRYLDYGVFSSLREMKAMIEAEGLTKDMQDDVKLGPGGIREIEFIVQTMQLVRGGSIAQLRERRLLKAVQQLSVYGLLPDDAVSELTAAYCYLRLVENRIQAISDQQTHKLPASPLNRARLCLSMRVADWDAFMQVLDVHRGKVHDHFNNILRRSSGESDKSSVVNHIDALWSGDAASQSALKELAELGFANPPDVPKQLQKLKLDSAIVRLDELGQARLSRLIPQLIHACSAESSPDVALGACLSIVEAIGRRSAYFSLLNENPAALKRLVTLAARSDFLSRQVATHPLLLDELLDPRVFSKEPRRIDLEDDLALRLSDQPSDDPELSLENIRNFQQAAVFRVAVADMSGVLPLMKVSGRLTDIAELVVEAALQLAYGEMVARHGRPMCDDGDGLREAYFGVLGYGKLGGLELGYGSDLDLVFLHDSTGEEQQTDGLQPLDNLTFFARLAQRLIHMLTMQTLSGSLYKVDTRLRPSGNSGQMVSSLRAFEKYHKETAWTWEHQSLLRSRAIAGPLQICDQFAAVRDDVLTSHVHFAELHEDVLSMRDRMRK
ncbi:MAG: bifunctional [glutamate--ammonia ligase]-adenylyl-L-tyrosine phosphorylase/[glutamate--ammonia-ligase] adenylyltransferase, partial [Gammaproteobacteria bacterium]|nr:bifunctional [glutamate--ammonia ligase]-adenylyl-L-tyrosine phosphorylase/[glutamate--ammonia-ligase] adenylyltransferase [Gammaproteobacteria bacterium]